MTKWLRDPFADEALRLFRVTLGFLSLVQALLTFPSVYLLYGDKGFLNAFLMKAVSGASVPSVMAPWFYSQGIPYENVVVTLTLCQIVASLAVMLGWRFRFSVVILWLTHTFFMNSGELSVYGVNRYLHLFSFVSMFFPLTYRLQSKTKTESIVNSDQALWILRGLLAITYLHAGLSKAVGVDWWTGDAVWRAINLPEFRQFDLFWLGQYPSLFKILSWSTLLFEIGYLFAMFSRSLRLPWVLVMVSMHVGISLFMGLHFFAFAMTMFNVALFLYSDIKYYLRADVLFRGTSLERYFYFL